MKVLLFVFISVFLFTIIGCEAASNNKPYIQRAAAQKIDEKNSVTQLNNTATGRRTVLHGEIVAIEYYDAGNCMNSGIHIRLKTATAVLPVHLGPVWYINQQDRLLTIGATAAVTGLQIELNGQPAVVAIELTTDLGTLKLRDDRGVPYWRGQRRNMKWPGPVCPMDPAN